jgi:hypothetical protein
MKISQNYFYFFKSTLTVALVSGLCGLASILAGHNFWPAFILSCALQYVLFTFVGNLINSYYAYQSRIKTLDKLEPLSTMLECAACAHVNVMTFMPDENERLEFECAKCKSKNVVNINFTVAKVTEFKEPMMATPVVQTPTQPL